MKFTTSPQEPQTISRQTLVTIILIIITLFAGIAVSGFVFGLFGTFTSAAQVSAFIESCSAGTPPGGHGTCTLTLVNNGASNTKIGGTCSVTYGGSVRLGTVTESGTVIAAGGAAQTAHCVLSSGTPTVGTAVAGQIGLTNGGQAEFFAVWSA